MNLSSLILKANLMCLVVGLGFPKNSTFVQSLKSLHSKDFRETFQVLSSKVLSN